MTTIVGRYPAVAVAIPIGVVLAVAELAGGGSLASALVSLAIVLGWAVGVTLLRRRSETAGVLAGRPADERWEHISVEACALALGVSGLVVLGAFAVTTATAGPWQPYAFIAAVMAVSYLASLLVLRARH